MTLRMTEQRRICWPDPDATCLEGGCGYCNGHRFRNVSSIRVWARKTGPVPNRYGGQTQDAVVALNYGADHGWCNAEARVVQ